MLISMTIWKTVQIFVQWFYHFIVIKVSMITAYTHMLGSSILDICVGPNLSIVHKNIFL